MFEVGDIVKVKWLCNKEYIITHKFYTERGFKYHIKNINTGYKCFADYCDWHFELVMSSKLKKFLTSITQ